MEKNLKIKIYNGNLLDADEDVIVHHTNIEGKMGAGVALAIKRRWPEVYAAYSELCNKTPDKDVLLGRIQYIPINHNQQICNFFAQSLTPRFDEGKRCTDYGAFESCLLELNRVFSGKSVAFPYRIGSALGGGDWGYILDMIIENCPDINISFYKIK